jgi:hypothetical protein
MLPPLYANAASFYANISLYAYISFGLDITLEPQTSACNSSFYRQIFKLDYDKV